MAPRTSDDEVTTWAVAAGHGDRDALACFIRATQRDVLRFLAHLSGADVAEDLAQETYLRAVRSLPGFAAQASARTWLLSIARRVAADDVRRARRRPRTNAVRDWDEVTGSAASPTRSVQPAPDGEVLLRSLVRELDDDRRHAFVLTQVLGMGYAQVAEICGCPIGTIRSRVARAREDLVAAMEFRPRRDREA